MLSSSLAVIGAGMVLYTAGSVLVSGNLASGLFVFVILLFIGGSFGVIAWALNMLSMWHSSLTIAAPDRDPAVEALRERYARGDIDGDQFESMLHRLNES